MLVDGLPRTFTMLNEYNVGPYGADPRKEGDREQPSTAGKVSARPWRHARVTRERVPRRVAGLTGTNQRLSTAGPGKSKDQRMPFGRAIARSLSPYGT